MQNSATPQSGGNWQSSPTAMYSNHQRQSSTSRTYSNDVNERRDDQSLPIYGDQQYPMYPANVSYNYNNPYPSGSRRVSGPKTSTPPSSSSPANPSPSTQYYPRSELPYQPSSAPPQVSSHPIPQPQTAHPYGGYYNYYDQSQAWQTYPQYPQTRPPEPQRSVDYSYPAYNSGWQRPPNTAPYMPPSTWQSNPTYYPPQPSATVVNPPPTKKAKKEPKEESVLGKRILDSDDDKKDGKKKKVKEPAPPKAPAKSHLHPPRQAQSAWQLFFTDELNKAKASAQQGDSPGSHSKLNVAQIAKDAGAAYAALNEEQKAYYAQKVQESKDQYAIELAAWQKTLTPEDIRAENAFRAQQRKEGKSRKGNLKDPNAPKKPLSAYFLFLKSIREDDELRAKVWGEESETTKQSVLAAERWRGLTDDEKRPYLSQAEKDKQDYEAARRVYEDDAAARARGEAPAPAPAPASATSKPVTFTQDFQAFDDPLHGMDLSGLEGIADEHAGEQWGELQQLVGQDERTTSVAPPLTDATNLSTGHLDIRHVAEQVDGGLSLPDLSSWEASTASIPDPDPAQVELLAPVMQDLLPQSRDVQSGSPVATTSADSDSA